jgi:outer membrane protein OmpA-like peptidoglycan-associated protein
MKPLLTALSALALATVATAAASADSKSAKASQHPRVGELATFEFDRGSAKLDRKNDGGPNQQLGEIAAWVQDNPDGFVVLDGHADPTGPVRANLRLSFARAKAVREQLLLAGVDADHIVIAAFGNNGPQHTRDRTVVAWGSRAGMKAIVARARAIGPSIISTGLLSELDLNPQPGAVATR